MSIVADTCGRHDALCGASNARAQRGEVRDAAACTGRSRTPATGSRSRWRSSGSTAATSCRRQLLQGRARRRRRRAALRRHAGRAPARTWSCAPSCRCSLVVANTPHVLDPRDRVHRSPRCGSPRGRDAPTTRADRALVVDARGRARVPEHRRRAALGCRRGEPDVTEPILDEVVEPRAPWARRRASAARRCAIVDLDGNQAVDCLSTTPHDPAERYSAPDTIVEQGNIFLIAGSRLLVERGPADDDGHRRRRASATTPSAARAARSRTRCATASTRSTSTRASRTSSSRTRGAAWASAT